MGRDQVVYRTSLRFNAIYVIESLPERDLRTGRDLFEQVIGPATLELSSMHAEYCRIQSKTELLDKLRAIAHAARVANHHPFVHIEAHGSEDGFALADGDRVSWREVVPLLAEINVACKNNLVLVAILCFGWNLTPALMPSDRAPVFMLVGPPAPMKAGDLLDATRRFYTALMSEFDVNRALDAMNEGLSYAEWPLKPATAEILYCRVFREYLADFASESSLQDRENQLVAQLDSSRGLSLLEAAALRLEVRRDLKDHRGAYERHRQRFLMLDLFPDDQGRFGLTYDLCFRTQSIDGG